MTKEQAAENHRTAMRAQRKAYFDWQAAGVGDYLPALDRYRQACDALGRAEEEWSRAIAAQEEARSGV